MVLDLAAIIRTDNLVYRYGSEEGTKLVLDGVSLNIERGSFVAVLGHNGSGKSTLAKQFNAILLPEGGKVYVEGMDTADAALVIEIRRRIGLVFQNPDNQIVSNVVEEDVAFAPENLGIEPEEIRRRVDNALKIVKMYEYRCHAPHRLSGGQKQRVAIAGVLAMEPKCIVLDEPTAMLDPMGRAEVIETIMDLCRNHGITVVLITHHMSEAVDCDRVIVMDDGKIAEDGAPREIFKKVERLKAMGLTVPESTQLIWSLNRAGMDIPLEAITPEECARAIFGELALK